MADELTEVPLGQAQDLTGQKFGRLTALAYTGDSKWQCVCECGKITRCDAYSMKKGISGSCGCLQKERASATAMRHGLCRNKKRPILYLVWSSMIQRCTNPKNKEWDNYGGRGIKVCERWRKFENFYADMFPSYRKGLTLDRIENEGDYEPGNCRWATSFEQSRNTRKNVFLTLGNETLAICDWAIKTGLRYCTITARIDRGWSIEDVLTKPLCFVSKKRRAHKE